MNCKQGDLAVFVKNGPNAGHIVTVLRPYCAGELIMGLTLEPAKAFRHGPVWWCESAGEGLVVNIFGRVHVHPVPDAWLRPLRDDDPAIDEVTKQPIEETT